MAEQDYKTQAIDLINQQHTMALATARQNTAWAAPVYYSFYKASFYFFSDPGSRHISEATENKQCAAAIYPHVDTWQAIRGIQMSGRIRSVPSGLTAVQAVQAYVRKFPFTRSFFNPGQALDLGSFEKQFHVRFYRLEPHLVYYLDNQVQFGFRIEVKLA